MPSERVSEPVRRRAFALSCVVPVENEAQQIGLYLRALHAHITGLSSQCEIIVVNDGSVDTSKDEILKVGADLSLRYIELSRTFGREFAIQAGFDAARGDCIVVIPDSCRHPIGAIDEMVRRWQAGVDMIYVVPDQSGAKWKTSQLALQLFYKWVVPRRSVRIPTDGGDFRLLDRKVVEALKSMPESGRYWNGLYAWVGFKSEPLKVKLNRIKAGQYSSVAPQRVRSGLWDITAFSTMPLRAVTLIGAVMAALAFLLGCWIVIERLLLGQLIPGFTTIATAICFLGGVQLVALGVVGEYVGRVFNEVKRRPQYVLSETIESDGNRNFSQEIVKIPNRA